GRDHTGRRHEMDGCDTVVCRSRLMLCDDHPKALRQSHRVLRRGGKFGALVFSAEEKNPYQGIPFFIVRRLGGKTPPHFSHGGPQRLRDLFRDSGFLDIIVRPVSLPRHFSSVTEVTQGIKDTIFIREAMAGLTYPDAQPAWIEIEQELSKLQSSAGIDLAGEMLIGVGSK